VFGDPVERFLTVQMLAAGNEPDLKLPEIDHGSAFARRQRND
jgi:hypothetical protein